MIIEVNKFSEPLTSGVSNLCEREVWASCREDIQHHERIAMSSSWRVPRNMMGADQYRVKLFNKNLNEIRTHEHERQSLRRE